MTISGIQLRSHTGNNNAVKCISNCSQVIIHTLDIYILYARRILVESETYKFNTVVIKIHMCHTCHTNMEYSVHAVCENYIYISFFRVPLGLNLHVTDR